jgi:transposase
MVAGRRCTSASADARVWERVFAALTQDRDNRYLMLDSTIVRAHQQAATRKGGPRIRRWGVPEAD